MSGDSATGGAGSATGGSAGAPAGTAEGAAQEAAGRAAAEPGAAPEGAFAGDPALRRDMEAVLMVVDQPVEAFELARGLGRPVGAVADALEELSAAYTAEDRGFDLRRVAEGWRIYTRPECAEVVEQFLKEGQEVKLTQAALETLAVVAYRQPVSRGRVSAVRGVNCDGVMRTLVLRGLIEEAGHDAESGAILYRTTGYFLERLGLLSLDELPDLAPFLPDDIEGIDDTGEHPT